MSPVPHSPSTFLAHQLTQRRPPAHSPARLAFVHAIPRSHALVSHSRFILQIADHTRRTVPLVREDLDAPTVTALMCVTSSLSNVQFGASVTSSLSNVQFGASYIKSLF